MNGHQAEWWCQRCGCHSDRGAQIVEVTVTWKPIYATGRPADLPKEKSFRLCTDVDCNADALERIARDLRRMKSTT